MTPTVDDFMTRGALTIDCRDSLAEALEVMRTHQVRHLVVLDSREQVIGMLSERDVLRLQSDKRVSPEVLPVGEAMTPDPVTVDRREPLAVVAEEMAWRGCGCVIVMEGARAIGVFTTSDALRALSAVLARKVDAAGCEVSPA
jgi:acetoin utilization protein AcuB